MADKTTRAFSLLEIKGFDDDKRVISGIATSPSVDRMGDIVEMDGVEVAADIPLFLYHDSTKTVGRAQFGKPTKKGIPFTAQLPKVMEEGLLKQRVDEAWQMLRYKLINAVSIGFRALEYSFIEGGGIRFAKTEVMELSLVPVPAQPDAVIQSLKSADPVARAAVITQIKSIDQQQRRTVPGASGALPGGRPDAGKSGSPDASGTQRPASGGFSFSRSTKGIPMKTLQEMIEARSQKSARMNELVDLRKQENRQFTADEGKEFDDLDSDVSELDDEIRIKRFEERQANAGTLVRGKSSEEGSASRGGLSFVRKADPDEAFKGQAFTRKLIAKAAAFAAMREGNFTTPAQIAEHRWGKSHPNLVNVIKAGVAGGGTGSGEWGAELAQSDSRYTGDFIEYLYSLTVFDRLPLRSVPARVHIKGQDGAATGYWTGESRAIAVSKPDFSDVELTPLKVGAIAVCSKELIADSSPSAEMWIRDSIAQASGQRVDTTFLGAAAASAGVSPAGILNGLSGLAPSGTDSAALRADLMALYVDFLAAKNASGLVQIMTPSMAKAISLMVNALGQTEFPTINANGGTLLGDQVFTGDNVTPGNWILLKPSDIWKIGDGGIDVSMSDTATIEQDSAPAGAGDTPTAASATLMSLWQTEQVGFKVVRRINYAKRRTSAVKFLADAEYGGVVS
ncbi:MAG: phage major capsid protein [Pseudomonadota bacterium]